MFRIICSLAIVIYSYLIIVILKDAPQINYKTVCKIIFCTVLLTVNSFSSDALISFILRSLIVILFLVWEFFGDATLIFNICAHIYVLRFIFQMLILIILNILNIHNTYALEVNVFSAILTLMFVYIFKEQLLKIVKIEEINNNRTLAKYIASNIILFIIITMRMFFSNLIINEHTTLELLLVFVVFNLALVLFREKHKTSDYIKNYQKIVDYSQFTEGLLTEYKSFIHEYKNRLVIIKDLANPQSKELHEFINSLIEVKAPSKYDYLMDIKNVPIPGIKGLINYKLLKMKELNIAAEIYVDDDITTIPYNLDIKEKNNLYTIMGVILDNAIEASNESAEKMISLHFLLNNNGKIEIIIANTYKSVDLDKLEQKGFSTKGENRGLGLYIVKEIIKHSNSLMKETKIVDNYFVQKIIIDSTK